MMGSARDHRSLLAQLLSRGLRARLASAAGLGAVELASIAVAARLALSGARGPAALVGVAAALAALLRGVLGVGNRLRLQERLHVAVVDAALSGDVLESALGSPSDDDAVFDGIHHGSAVVAVTGPRLVASALSLPICVGVVAAPLGHTLGALVAAVAVGMGASVGWAQRTARQAEARSWRSFEPVLESFTAALRGRVEIVALGAEGRVASQVVDRLSAWRSVARASEVMAAVVARVPVALGLGTIALVVALVGLDVSELATRGALSIALLPAASELARSVTELARARARHRSFLSLLAVPAPRVEGQAEPPAAADVALEGATFAYGRAGGAAVSGVSLLWRAGTVVVLRGQNGTGKSTVLRGLLGLVPCVEGRLTIGGVSAADLAWSRWRRRCALLVQEPYVRPGMSVRELATWLLEEAPSEAAIDDALAVVGVAQAKDTDALRLSVGERRRVVLARVLLHRTATHVLLDEPDASLDRIGVAIVRTVVERLRAQGVSVAIATHDRELMALADATVEMGEG